MKTKFLIIILFFVSAIIFWILGAYAVSEVQNNIWKFHNSSTVPGSSGGGYPSYDGVWIYFETGSALLAIGILITIWKNRK
jgi:hypothetical protein